MPVGDLDEDSEESEEVDMEEGLFADNLHMNDVRATAQLLAANAERFTMGHFGVPMMASNPPTRVEPDVESSRASRAARWMNADGGIRTSMSAPLARRTLGGGRTTSLGGINRYSAAAAAQLQGKRGSLRTGCLWA